MVTTTERTHIFCYKKCKGDGIMATDSMIIRLFITHDFFINYTNYNLLSKIREVISHIHIKFLNKYLLIILFSVVFLLRNKIHKNEIPSIYS